MGEKKKSERFYWLQLSKDFFDDYKIKILISLEHGPELVLLYLKLLLESINRSGLLRFSKKKTYTEKQLSAVLDVNENLIKIGLKELVALELIRLDKDGTIYIPGVETMTGSITKRGLQKREERVKRTKGEQNATANEQKGDKVA